MAEDKIRQIFARAHHVLAQNYQQKASESQAQNMKSNLGQDIQAAAEHLEKAWYWSGRKLEAAAKDVIERSKQLGAKIAQGTQWTVSETADSIKDLGDEIGIFWTQLTAANPPSVTFASTQSRRPGRAKQPSSSANRPHNSRYSSCQSEDPDCRPYHGKRAPGSPQSLITL